MTTPPVARVYDQVANRPRVIVDEQILHVADLTVLRFDMMTNHRVATAQVAVIRSSLWLSPVALQFLGDSVFGSQAARVRAHAPQARAAPVVRVPVVFEVVGFVLP